MKSRTTVCGVFVIGVVCGLAGSVPWMSRISGAQESTFTYERVRHVGILVRDVEQSAAALESVGFRNIRVQPRDGDSGYDRYYHGAPAEHSVWQGFWRGAGETTIELLAPGAGDSEWRDYLEQHGEGIHHITFMVPDLPAEIARYKAAGWEEVQGGKWSMPDGYGAYAYLRPQGQTGPVFELVTRVPFTN